MNIENLGLSIIVKYTSYCKAYYPSEAIVIDSTSNWELISYFRTDGHVVLIFKHITNYY